MRIIKTPKWDNEGGEYSLTVVFTAREIGNDGFRGAITFKEAERTYHFLGGFLHQRKKINTT